MNRLALTLQEQHFEEVKTLLFDPEGRERAAYLLCGTAQIMADPWHGQPRCKYFSVDVLPIPEKDVESASDQHITWRTDSFVRALKQAQDRNLTVALIHSHPGGLAEFSEQDDRNEADLVQLAHNRNGDQTRLLSLVLTVEGSLIGRCWTSPQTHQPLDLISSVGDRIELHYPERGKQLPLEAFKRQALALGRALNQDFSQLRVGVVGCGGTGSAVAMFLPRLGIQKIALFDKDIVEETNLNRLHGATLADAKAKRLKIEVIKESLEAMGLGAEVKTYSAWVNEPQCQDALKACDIVFGCTDDHAGRLMLNRFAYFYLTPVFDMGLAIEVSSSEPPEIQTLDGRVTTLMPGCRCLLCRDVINLQLAGDEALKREQPEEYERRKAEAYVQGEGNPSPAVVLFTTSVANMALEEMLHRFQGFRGDGGAIPNRVRQYNRLEDRCPGAKDNESCPVCRQTTHWGQGDVQPFLGLI